MTEQGSVTDFWLPSFKAKKGDAEAALWRRFSARVTQQARNVLRKKGVPCRVADEDDIANTVFRRLCALRETQESKLDEVFTSDDLWSFFLLLISGKVKDQKKWLGAVKRAKERGESSLLCNDAELDSSRPMNWIVDDGPLPESALINAEERQRLIGLLTDDALRETAGLRLAGLKKSEIAKRLGVRRQTVYDRLKRIMTLWRLSELVEGDVNDDEAVRATLDELMATLPDDTTRGVAELYLQGFDSFQIAQRLKKGEHMIELELDVILAHWRDEALNGR